jgi:hypothetical protein
VRRPLLAPCTAELRVETTTDTDGRFALDDPTRALDAEPDARFELEIAAPGFAPLALHALALPGAGTLDLGALVLQGGRHVEGVVRDADGVPVAHALIGLAPVEPDAGGGIATAVALATTHRDGTFEADGLPPGAWTLVVAAPAEPETRFEAVVSDTAELAPLALDLPRAAALAGHVLTEPERGFDGVRVHALPLERLPPRAWPRTDAALVLGARTVPVEADGRFELDGLEHGVVYALRALPLGADPLREDAWAGAALVHAPALDLRLTLRWGTTLELLAVDGHGGPVERFTVAVEGAERDEDEAEWGGVGPRPVPFHAGGRASLAGLRPRAGDEVRVAVRSPGRVAWRSEAYTLLPGGTLQLGRVMLTDRPTLAVRVVDATTGAPVADAVARLVPADGREHDAEAASDIHGRLALEDEPRTPRRVGVVARGLAPAVFASPFALDEHELVVALEPEAHCAVSVVGADGNPAVGIAVACAPPTEPGGTRADPALAPDVATPRIARTDTRGVALFGGLGPGEHDFRIVRDGVPEAYERGGVRIAAGALATLALTADFEARVRGVVLDGGRPVPGAEIVWRRRGRGAIALALRADDRGRFEVLLERGAWRVALRTTARARPVELDVRLERGTEDLVLEAQTTGRWLQAVLPGGAAAPDAPVHVIDAWDSPPELEAGLNPFALARTRAADARTDARGLFAVDERRGTRVAVLAASDRGRLAGGAFADLPLADDADPLLVLQPSASLALERERWALPGDRALVLVHDELFPAVPARVVFPYRGDALELDELVAGAWTAWRVELDGLGRARTAEPVATLDLVAGQRTRGALPR